MEENDIRIDQLLQKLENLMLRQDAFSKEIGALKDEINRLKLSTATLSPTEIGKSSGTIESDAFTPPLSVNVPPIPSIPIENNLVEQFTPSVPKAVTTSRIKPVTEKYIGENLTNKIGIGITIIGVGIGAKYSIDHDLISPLTRIILGYLMGLALLGFGIRLKKNYENFSAVLVSGAIAIMYFITYAAFSFYGLFSGLIAFMLMVFFTIFTVLTAIHYNKQVIALIGLVGAYAVPFLLSDGTGDVKTLFSYMAIINIGILFIAFRKYWKALYYSSFALTWIIFMGWYGTSYDAVEHFRIATTFLCIFFLTFYFIFLAYKIIQKEKFEYIDVLLLMANSFIFYGLGYEMLSSSDHYEHILGLFTLCNAVIHFVISALVYQQKLADRNLFFLVIGLALVFVTIAIPVELDGHWVTLLWVGEATVLFWIGTSRQVSMYERLSYPLMILAFISIIHDWLTYYNVYTPEQPGTKLTPVFNVYFLTSLLFAGCFALIAWLNRKDQNADVSALLKSRKSMVSFTIYFILICVLFGAIGMEISNYFNQLYQDSEKVINNEAMGYADRIRNDDWMYYKLVWIINYAMLFFSGLAFSMKKIITWQNSGRLFLVLNTIVLLVFLTSGLYMLSELRDSYLNQTFVEYYHRSSFNILIRYISYGLAALLLLSIHKSIFQKEEEQANPALRAAWDIILYGTILWVASSEFITWMNILNFSYSYKLGLSILWGIYALMLIGLGIWKDRKHLRLMAILLFTVTLVKLFFYDISLLGTIAKTVVFVSLGILLLIISFLYNKYKDSFT